MLFLSSLFCSKGDKAIEPVIPSTNVSPQVADADMIYVGDSRESQERLTGYHPQVSPFMPLDVFEKMDSKLSSIIGDGEAPKDQCIFLYAEPIGIWTSNPPLFQIAFIAPRNSISPDNISVIVDQNDISKSIYYSVHYSPKRKASFYIGSFKPETYLDPRNQHQLSFSIRTSEYGALQKNFSFAVPQDETLAVTDAFFLLDSDKKKPLLDKLFVSVRIPQDVKIDDRLLSPSSWTMKYENSTDLPSIKNIEKKSRDTYIISFTSDVAPKTIVKIMFSPSDGMRSKILELKSPPKYDDRGGGYYRKGASGDCDACEGPYSMSVAAMEAAPCDDYDSCDHRHEFDGFLSGCPDEQVCDGQLNRFFEITEYEEPHTDYCETDTYIRAGLQPYSVDGQTDCYLTFSDTFECYKDAEATYYLIGYPLPYNGTVCDLASSIPQSAHSDVEPPYEIDVEFSKIDPSTDCGVDAEYRMMVRAKDNHCVKPYPIFCLKYMSHDPPYGQDGETYFERIPGFSQYNTYENYTQFERMYLIDDPNIFACVEYLKVVIKDEKGNWNSKYVYPGGVLPNELPYPTSITMSFGDRDTYEQGDPPEVPPEVFSNQYVNLDRIFGPEIDPVVCVPKNNQPSHGPYIYVEVQVDPPLPGIDILVEYLDPEFNKGTNFSPTNDLATNPHLGDQNNALIWGNHPAYGSDGRTLGDNYNYSGKYEDCVSDPTCDEDALIYYHFKYNQNPPQPCFMKPTDCYPELPPDHPPEYCLNDECEAGVTLLTTNINGLAAVYFNTCGHGGDNFIFTACGFYQNVKRDCIKAAPNIIFTLWRKMDLVYGYMRDRNGQYPDPECPDQPADETGEHQGDHQINGSDLLYDSMGGIKGVYDDCFIEFDQFTNKGVINQYVPYFLSNELIVYAQSSLGHPLGNDTIGILGIDHAVAFPDPNMNSPECKNKRCGITIVCSDPSLRNYYGFVCVGNIDDQYKAEEFRRINDKEVREYNNIAQNSSAHEAFWVLRQDQSPLPYFHVWCLMGPDQCCPK